MKCWYLGTTGRSFVTFWPEIFLSGSPGASHWYSDSDNGLADEIQHIPRPYRLTYSVGPSASATTYFKSPQQTMTHGYYICVSSVWVYVECLKCIKLIVLFLLHGHMEVIAVCSEIYTKHINRMCGQNVEFGYDKPGSPMGFWRAKNEHSQNFIFMLPCIVRDFFLNNRLDALIIQIYSVIKLYMFRASSLPIVRSFLLYIRHW